MKKTEIYKRAEHFVKKAVWPIFFLYMLVLIVVIVLKFPTGLVSSAIKMWRDGEPFVRGTPQLVPFRTTILYVSLVHSFTDWFIKNLAANILMFVPYGLIVPVLAKNKHRIGLKVVLWGCLLSVFIEIFQYITNFGQCDIDDVILNTFGVLLGVFIYYLVRKVWTRRSESVLKTT